MMRGLTPEAANDSNCQGLGTQTSSIVLHLQGESVSVCLCVALCCVVLCVLCCVVCVVLCVCVCVLCVCGLCVCVLCVCCVCVVCVCVCCVHACTAALALAKAAMPHPKVTRRPHLMAKSPETRSVSYMVRPTT